MARCAAAGRGVTNLPTAVRGPNLYCSADGGFRLREVGVFNTTTSAVAVGLGIATALGTVAGASTEFCEERPGPYGSGDRQHQPLGSTPPSPPWSAKPHSEPRSARA